jgi:hypothetical protein
MKEVARFVKQPLQKRGTDTGPSFRLLDIKVPDASGVATFNVGVVIEPAYRHETCSQLGSEEPFAQSVKPIRACLPVEYQPFNKAKALVSGLNSKRFNRRVKCSCWLDPQPNDHGSGRYTVVKILPIGCLLQVYQQRGNV